YVDRPELLLHTLGRGLHGVRVGDVEWKHERRPAERFDVGACALQSFFSARDQPDRAAVARESLRDRAAESGRRTCDDDDFIHDIRDVAYKKRTDRSRCTGYSERKAIAGSTDAARRAGIALAMI